MKRKIERMWINQPSTLQNYHKFHGELVLADLTSEKQGRVTVYFTKGHIVGMDVSKDALDYEWPEHLREKK